MAKRGALTDINRDNWDDPEEDEEAGTFQRATEKDLQKRVIKKAVRRLGTGGDSDAKPVFGGFTGFGTTTMKPAAATFSFLSSAATPTTTLPAPAMKVPETSEKVAATTNGGSGTDSYNADLKELNMSFVKWVKECVDKNPLCILTPVLNDYQKYLKELDEEKNKIKLPIVSETKKTEEQQKLPPSASTFKFMDLPQPSAPATTTSTFSANTKSDEKKSSEFSFGSAKTETTPKTDTPATSGFSFANTKAASATPAPVFSGFGSSSTPFSFGASTTPFTFGNVTQAPKEGETKNDDGAAAAEEDEDEPPKVEFTPVVEKDSVYDKRCKVFVKQGEEFKDRGVGTLYIKPVSGKTQVIVRADTSLGNILLNTLLTASMPTKRMGKNNVMIATAVDGKPTSVLLRVKTSEDADELLAQLEKNKN